MKQKIINFTKKNHNEIGIVAFAVIYLFICFYFAKPLFESNDDMGMIRIISGFYGTEYSGNPIFMSPILGHVLAALYQIQPLIPWYGITIYLSLLIALLLSLALIFSQINSKIEHWAAAACFLGLYMYICVRINFASCSLILWFIVFVWALVLSLRNNKLAYRDCLLVLLLLLGYLIRPSMAKIAVAFILPLALSMLCLETGRKRLACLCIPFVMVFLLTTINPDYKTLQPESYRNLQTARSQLTGTILGDINSYTESALEKAGWSQVDYELLRNWWTYDESLFGTIQIEGFLENNNPKFSESILINKINNLRNAMSFKAANNKVTETKIYLLPIFLFTLLLISFESRDTKQYQLMDKEQSGTSNEKALELLVIPSQQAESRKQYPMESKLMKLTWLLPVYIIVAAYGLSTIRMPMRVAIPIYIYFLMTLIIFRPKSLIKSPFGSLKTVAILLVTIMLYYSSLNIQDLNREAKVSMQNKEYQDHTISVVKDINGADTVFFTFSPGAQGQGINPLIELRQSVLYDRVPGGWSIGTDFYYAYIKKYGCSNGREFIEFALDNNKVVFSYWNNPGVDPNQYMGRIVQHFNDHYRETGKIYKAKLVADTRFLNDDRVKTGWMYYRIKAEENK